MRELPERENANPAEFAEKVPKPTSKAYTSSDHKLSNVFNDEKLLMRLKPLGDDSVIYIRALVKRVARNYSTVTALRDVLKVGGIPKCFKEKDPDTPYDITILKHLYMGGLYGHM